MGWWTFLRKDIVLFQRTLSWTKTKEFVKTRTPSRHSLNLWRQVKVNVDDPTLDPYVSLILDGDKNTESVGVTPISCYDYCYWLCTALFDPWTGTRGRPLLSKVGVLWGYSSYDANKGKVSTPGVYMIRYYSFRCGLYTYFTRLSFLSELFKTLIQIPKCSFIVDSTANFIDFPNKEVRSFLFSTKVRIPCRIRFHVSVPHTSRTWSV